MPPVIDRSPRLNPERHEEINTQSHYKLAHAPAAGAPVALPGVDAEADGRAAEGQGDAEEEEAEEAWAERVTRKRTYWMFADEGDNDIPAGVLYCSLGCLTPDLSRRLSYSAPNTSAISRHVKSKHPDFFHQYQKAGALEANWNEIEARVAQAKSATLQKLAKKRRTNDTFMRQWADGHHRQLRAGLTLLLWGISHGISRAALNCQLLDSYHHQLGAVVPKNRHLYRDMYLPQLDAPWHGPLWLRPAACSAPRT
jgi:hypothetical protein